MADREAVVYKKGVSAATLSSSGGVVTFRYQSEYLTSSGPAVATSLPKVPEELSLPAGATPAFFSGLLPEGQRLRAMRERLKTSLSDDLGLLMDIGADLIGDVQVLPPGADPGAGRETLLLPRDTSDYSFAEIRSEVFGSRASGLPGVQDKVSSKMLNAPVRFAGYDYLLKLNPVDVPMAVENEHYYLILARRCGIAVGDSELLTDREGQHALRLRRFDRRVVEGEVVRLAQEDAAQVMDVYPAAKYEVDLIDMAQKLIELCPAKKPAALVLYRLFIFNWLIGNGDAHAKNFSILESASGSWIIAPGYDLLCTRFYDDRTMALPLKGERTGWTRRLLVASGEELGIPSRLAVKELDRLLVNLADMPEEILSGALPFPLHLRKDVASFLKKRAKALQ